MLSLPMRYVDVIFEDGTKENVAMQDTLDKKEAHEFQTDWSVWRDKKVVRVELRKRDGTVLKFFEF